MNSRSIEFRLAMYCLFICMLLFFGFGAYTYSRLEYYLRTALQESLAHRAQQIEDTLLRNISQTGESYIADQIEVRYAPARNDRFVRIRKKDSAAFYTSRAPNDKSFNPEHVPLENRPNYFNKLADIDGEGISLISVPCTIDQNNYVIDVGTSNLSSRGILRDYLITLLIVLPVMVLISTGGAFVLIRQVLIPVRKIANAAEEITSQNLSKRLPVVQTGDSLERLAVVLNQMIDRLDVAFQHANRFTADASHELRTPLTIMRGELEALSMEAGLPVNIREKAGSILEETERLVKIIHGLLAISRLEAGEALLEKTRFDLSALVATTAEQMLLLAEEKSIELVCEAKGPVEIFGDQARMKQVLVNLLDNAIKYSFPDGCIRLQTKVEGERAVLEVMDEGPGIPYKALPHVFDRFYRVDDMRSKREEGAGLGLSIVRSICIAHGAEVQINNRPEGGCRIKITMPLATETRRNGASRAMVGSGGSLIQIL